MSSEIDSRDNYKDRGEIKQKYSRRNRGRTGHKRGCSPLPRKMGNHLGGGYCGGMRRNTRIKGLLEDKKDCETTIKNVELVIKKEDIKYPTRITITELLRNELYTRQIFNACKICPMYTSDKKICGYCNQTFSVCSAHKKFVKEIRCNYCSVICKTCKKVVPVDKNRYVFPMFKNSRELHLFISTYHKISGCDCCQTKINKDLRNIGVIKDLTDIILEYAYA